MALPLVYLALRAFEDWGEVVFEVILRAKTLAILIRSVLLAGVTTTASVAVAGPLAWLTTRTDLPGRRGWGTLAAPPLGIPTYGGGVVLVSLLGSRGVVEGALEP